MWTMQHRWRTFENYQRSKKASYRPTRLYTTGDFQIKRLYLGLRAVRYGTVSPAAGRKKMGLPEGGRYMKMFTFVYRGMGMGREGGKPLFFMERDGTTRFPGGTGRNGRRFPFGNRSEEPL